MSYNKLKNTKEIVLSQKFYWFIQYYSNFKEYIRRIQFHETFQVQNGQGLMLKKSLALLAVAIKLLFNNKKFYIVAQKKSIQINKVFFI